MCSGKETPSHSRATAVPAGIAQKQRRRAVAAKACSGAVGVRLRVLVLMLVKPSTASGGGRRRSRSAIFAAAGAGLVNDDAAQRRQSGRKPLPEPRRQPLAGGILQAGNLVEIMVIERLVERGEGGRKLG